MKLLSLILLMSCASCQLRAEVPAEEPSPTFEEAVLLSCDIHSDPFFDQFRDEFDKLVDGDSEVGEDYCIRESFIPPWIRSLGITVALGFYDIQDYLTDVYASLKKQLVGLYAVALSNEKR